MPILTDNILHNYPCCEMMEYARKNEYVEFPITYGETPKDLIPLLPVMYLHEAGKSVLIMNFCPFCGKDYRNADSI